MEENPNPAERNPNSLSPVFESLCQACRSEPIRHWRATAAQVLLVPGCLSFLLSSFLVPPVYEASEGLAAFYSWIFVLVRRLDAIPPDLAAASLRARKKDPTSTEQKARGPAEKTGRLIRCPARMRPLKRARTAFSGLGKRTGASPSCLRVSHNACLQPTFGFADNEADAAAFRRARENAFIQRRITLPGIRFPVKVFQIKVSVADDMTNEVARDLSGSLTLFKRVGWPDGSRSGRAHPRASPKHPLVDPEQFAASAWSSSADFSGGAVQKHRHGRND